MASHTSCLIASELDSGYIAGCCWQLMRKMQQKDTIVQCSLFMEFIHSIHSANSDSQVKYDFLAKFAHWPLTIMAIIEYPEKRYINVTNYSFVVVLKMQQCRKHT